MIVTKMALPRRTFLRGVSATLALPLLDAMIPALTAAQKTVAMPVRRLGFVYVPMGTHQPLWTPKQEGRLTELSPILQSLTPYMDQTTILSNLELKNAYSGGADHTTANAAFLSGVKAKRTDGSDYELGTTIDQIAARQISTETPLPSLELATDFNYVVGNCDNGYGCVYMNTMAWSSPTSPLPTEANPRVVFERMFGDGGTLSERQADLRQSASILDGLSSGITSLQKRLGAGDRTRVAGYLDAIREVERRIQRAEQQDPDALPTSLERPIGAPQNWEDHVKLMFELQVLAFQADITRVITFQLSREVSTRTYPQIGVPDGHHPTSHHQLDPVKIAKLTKISTYHVSLFAYYLERLRATAEGGGTLLDNSLLLLGSGLGNPDIHDHTNLPIVVAGGGSGTHKGGRHLICPTGTPMTNLLVTLLDKSGVDIDRFADSTGEIGEL
jgi:hypothetical protein